MLPRFLQRKAKTQQVPESQGKGPDVILRALDQRGQRQEPEESKAGPKGDTVELVIERQTSPSELVRVCQVLKETLSADIFAVRPVRSGVALECRVPEVASCPSSIANMPELAAQGVSS